MKNLTSMQISREFKQVLHDEKKEEESFEDYIKRLRDVALDKNNSNNYLKKNSNDPYDNPKKVIDKMGRSWKFPKEKDVS